MPQVVGPIVGVALPQVLNAFTLSFMEQMTLFFVTEVVEELVEMNQIILQARISKRIVNLVVVLQGLQIGGVCRGVEVDATGTSATKDSISKRQSVNVPRGSTAVPMPQVVEEVLEVEVPQILKGIMKVMQLVPEERTLQRIAKQIPLLPCAAGRGSPGGDGPDQIPRAHVRAKRRTEYRCASSSEAGD